MGFEDRRDAGRQLASKLGAYREGAVVYALPRGGVETAVEVAKVLHAPLSMSISRKIGHPDDPEYAVCAVTETGPLVCTERERVSLDASWLQQAEKAARIEAKRRRETYMAGKEPVSAAGKVAIVVDDGIATGLTMRAAAAEILKQKPKALIVAVPAAPRDAVDELRELADAIVVLENPDHYRGSVGAYYSWFPQLTDQEVMSLLGEADV